MRFRLRLTSRSEGDAESANVLAEIPGTDWPGEIVLLVAHLDSWDVGTGAQDDGTGVAVVCEAARIAAAVSGGAARRSPGRNESGSARKTLTAPQPEASTERRPSAVTAATRSSGTSAQNPRSVAQGRRWT